MASPLTVEDLEEGEICELPEVASRTKKNNTIASVLRVNPQPTAQHVVSLQNRISEFPAERLLDQSVEDIIEQPYVEHPVEPTPFLHTLEPLVEQPELEPTIVEAIISRSTAEISNERNNDAHLQDSQHVVHIEEQLSDTIQDRDREIHIEEGDNTHNNTCNSIDDINAFIDFISCKPTTPLLNSPPRINPIQPSTGSNPPTVTTQRKSSRLADRARNNPGRDTIQMAQQVLINKLGELSPKPKDNSKPGFDQLAQHLPKPLNDMKMEAIRTLIEKGNQSKSKNKKKNKVAPLMMDAVEVQGA